MLSRDDYFNHNNVEHLKIALQVIRYSLYRILEERGYLVYEKSEAMLGVAVDKLPTEIKLRKLEEWIK